MNGEAPLDRGNSRFRNQFERCRRNLGELARIHLVIDPSTRIMQASEPDWVGRLRKICLHVRAITGWVIGPGVEHVMATELRAGYEQMAFVWEHLPPALRQGDMDSGWWAEESGNGMLATYDHPIPQSLMLPAGSGGFRDFNGPIVYTQLAIWLGRLGLGYGLSLIHLSQVLGSEEDIEPHVRSALAGLVILEVP